MNQQQIFTLLIGGQAGDGAKEAAINIGRVFAKLGYDFFLSVDYPSLIRGGHNFARLSVSEKDKVMCDYAALDLLVAFNEDSISLHKKELSPNAIIFIDEEKVSNKNYNLFSLPVGKWAKDNSYHPLMRSAGFLGAIMWHFNLSLDVLNKVFTESFGEKAQPNIVLAKMGYEYAKNNQCPQISLLKNKLGEKRIFDGNEAYAEGLVAAGLENYFAYPMTPSSSILHYLAAKAKIHKLKVVQPENEIAVINMALGSVFVGKRTAVASTGGGVALMLEAIAMAGMMESPIVIADSQRASTSTGVPTRVAQGDINFICNLPGEFPFVVLSPGDTEEAYWMGGLALNISWQYQIPVLVLLDRHLSESITTLDSKKFKIKPLPHRLGKPGVDYQRYSYMPDGVSPLCFPGDKYTVVKQTSYEHNESGYISEDPKNTEKMCAKRFKKSKGLMKEMKKYSPIKIFGDKKAKNILIFTGSPKGAIIEAIKNISKPIKVIQLLWLEPFPAEQLLKEIKGARQVVCLEMNYTGQLEKLIKKKTGLTIKKNLRQYNSLPFMPELLMQKLNKLF